MVAALDAGLATEPALLTVARVRSAQGKPDEALALLDGALYQAEAHGRDGSRVSIEVLRALARSPGE